MSGNVIDSFLVALGFQTDTSGAEDYKKSLESVGSVLTQVASAATGIAAAVGWAVHKAAESMGELYSFAELNEVSARSMEALGKIAVENDGSLEGMKSTVQSLNKVIGEAVLGVGRGAMTFEKLGIAAKNADGSVKNVDDILSEVADKMQGMSRQEQLALGSKLGIDPQFVKVLAQGSDNLAQLRQEAELFNPFKEEDYEMADKVDKLFTKATKSIGTFAKQIAVSVFPVIKQMLEGYISWFKEFRKGGAETFSTGLKVLVAVLQTMWDWTVRVATVVRDVVQWFTQFKVVTWAAGAALAAFVAIKTYSFFMDAAKGIIGLTRTLMAFNASALLIPMLVGGIILAVALLIDEFVNFKEGNDSFLGDLVKDYPQLLTVINAISDGVAGVISWMQNLFAGIMPAFTALGGALMNLFNALWPAISFGVGVITSLFMGVLQVVAWVMQGIVQIIAFEIETAAKIITWLVDAFAGVVNGIASALNVLVGLFTGAWAAIKSSFVSVFDWIASKIDSVVGSVKSAVDWVSKVTGLGSVQIAASTQGSGAYAGATGGAGMGANALASNGPLGYAAAGPSVGGSTVSNSNNTNVTVPNINITTSDPVKAGQSVREELNKANRSSVRNGQSAVLL